MIRNPLQLFGVLLLLCFGGASGLVAIKIGATAPKGRVIASKTTLKKSKFALNRSQSQSSSCLTSTYVEARNYRHNRFPFPFFRRLASSPSQWKFKLFQRRRSKRILLGIILASIIVFAPAFSPAHAASMVTAAGPTHSRALGTFNFLPTKAELELSFRLLYAACSGAFVGLERSKADRPAGVRTMALVGLGACTYAICSVHGFNPNSALGYAPGSPMLASVKYDPSRMAANIASGVGFIGAGAIHKSKLHGNGTDAQNVVAGLTTAAAIWISAAVGVASGVGMYFVGAVATLATVSILKFAKLSKEDEPGFSWNPKPLEIIEESENSSDKRNHVSGLFGKGHETASSIQNDHDVSSAHLRDIRPIIIKQVVDSRLEEYLRKQMGNEVAPEVSHKVAKVLIEEEQEVLSSKNNTENDNDVFP